MPKTKKVKFNADSLAAQDIYDIFKPVWKAFQQTKPYGLEFFNAYGIQTFHHRSLEFEMECTGPNETPPTVRLDVPLDVVLSICYTKCFQFVVKKYGHIECSEFSLDNMPDSYTFSVRPDAHSEYCGRGVSIYHGIADLCLHLKTWLPDWKGKNEK